MNPVVPVLGKLFHDKFSEALGTGFYHFNIRNHIHGLAKRKEDTIFILAVVSNAEGGLKKLVEDLKQHYSKIVFFHVMNCIVKSALERYEFKHEGVFDPDTKTKNKALVWRKPKTLSVELPNEQAT